MRVQADEHGLPDDGTPAHVCRWLASVPRGPRTSCVTSHRCPGNRRFAAGTALRRRLIVTGCGALGHGLPSAVAGLRALDGAAMTTAVRGARRSARRIAEIVGIDPAVGILRQGAPTRKRARTRQFAAPALRALLVTRETESEPVAAKREVLRAVAVSNDDATGPVGIDSGARDVASCVRIDAALGAVTRLEARARCADVSSCSLAKRPALKSAAANSGGVEEAGRGVRIVHRAAMVDGGSGGSSRRRYCQREDRGHDRDSDCTGPLAIRALD